MSYCSIALHHMPSREKLIDSLNKMFNVARKVIKVEFKTFENIMGRYMIAVIEKEES